jgi:hypothetical protein
MTANMTIQHQSMVMSVSAHVEQLAMSRSRFYELVYEGFFLPPVYLLANRQPFYMTDVAERNRLAKETGIGVDGQVKVFYRRRRDASPVASKASKPKRDKRNAKGTGGLCAEVTAAVKSLGMTSITEEAVAEVISTLWPAGPADTDEGDIIRAVFQQLRRSGSA